MTSEAVWPPGTVLADRFKLTGAPLGEGSVGVVYPARDLEAACDVAVKIVHPHLAASGDAMRQLHADASVASRLQHPHVLRVHGLWSHAGHRFLVTDHVVGRTLGAMGQSLPADRVLALGVELADALSAVHQVGLVHGDVRPGSVLIGPSGALLFDFGRSGARPGETAPEVHAGAPPGVPADLYGLGIVLHRALTGSRAFEAATPWAVIGAQRASSPAAAGLPAGVERLLLRLLHPDPTRRPVDASAVGAALRALQHDPHRVLPAARQWIAPVRPRRNWAVHGTDPATGGPALVRRDLSRGAALSLAERLREEGWDVVAEPVGLGARDLMATAALATVLGLLVPVIGAVLGAGLGLVLLSSRCRPAILRALPRARAALPFSARAPGRPGVVVTGMLMCATAAWMLVFPPVAAVVALALAAVLWQRSGPARQSEGEAASAARALDALTRARMAVQGEPLDHELALLGEIASTEQEWRAGTLTLDELVACCDEVGRRVAISPVRDSGTAPVAALRAARAEVADKRGLP